MEHSLPLAVISYQDIASSCTTATQQQLVTSLLKVGIVGIRDVPGFQEKSRAFVSAARQFALLAADIKQQYAPNRDQGSTEGYELGAEWFKDQAGNWLIDDKKASFYAYVPDKAQNKWPLEVNLRTPYLDLGNLILQVGKKVLQAIEINASLGIQHEQITGYGRMLHYHKEGDATNANPNWCGAHYDHGICTGLMPAYYFCEGEAIEEPEEAGLFIAPPGSDRFIKISASDKSILFFQAGEFGQLASHDRIRATKHLVKKAFGSVERFAFSLFCSPDDNAKIISKSELTNDARYSANMLEDGGIIYDAWQKASYARYRASKS